MSSIQTTSTKRRRTRGANQVFSRVSTRGFDTTSGGEDSKETRKRASRNRSQLNRPTSFTILSLFSLRRVHTSQFFIQRQPSSYQETMKLRYPFPLLWPTFVLYPIHVVTTRFKRILTHRPTLTKSLKKETERERRDDGVAF